MLRFRYRLRPRKMQVYPGGGQGERLMRLRQIVTGLIRFERVEPDWLQADEARQYAERLLYLAVKNGDKDRQTMELADFWLLEKDLVHKLFKVLVPRYANYKTCYTDLHKLPKEYPATGIPQGVLELRGNPWPPIVARQRDTKFLLSNMLLSAARHDYYVNKQKQSPSTSAHNSTSPTTDPSDGSSEASAADSPPASVANSEFSSSVDPQPDKQSVSKDV
ncbi:unnamed protein product [Candidula unifasciata]|uniref:Large ribosomal subunit protein bL17m n=1 Tax=Candidula unifasciata TaxID=100452 RepID=A0A8S3YMN5_9EUPU|nr:unnamed protein product [Candidula unifasciata]